MGSVRRKHSAEFKAKVVLETLRGDRTVNEVASRYEIHPTQLSSWKKQVVEALPGLFSGRADKAAKNETELRGRLYEQIGRLKVELDWLKKKMGEEP